MQPLDQSYWHIGNSGHIPDLICHRIIIWTKWHMYTYGYVVTLFQVVFIYYKLSDTYGYVVTLFQVVFIYYKLSESGWGVTICHWIQLVYEPDVRSGILDKIGHGALRSDDSTKILKLESSAKYLF